MDNCHTHRCYYMVLDLEIVIHHELLLQVFPVNFESLLLTSYVLYTVFF